MFGRYGVGAEGKLGGVGAHAEYTRTGHNNPDIAGWDIDAAQHLFRAAEREPEKARWQAPKLAAAGLATKKCR